jgi:hypothetical protein
MNKIKVININKWRKNLIKIMEQHEKEEFFNSTPYYRLKILENILKDNKALLQLRHDYLEQNCKKHL